MFDFFVSTDLPRLIALLALASWLSLAVFNNIKDPQTNARLLWQMFRMEHLANESHLGQGLMGRKIEEEGFARRSLQWVIGAQILVALLLWTAAFAQIFLHLSLTTAAIAQASFNIALGGFFSLWAAFLCGGLYFGYWLKTPQIQQVHFTLLIIALLVWRL